MFYILLWLMLVLTSMFRGYPSTKSNEKLVMTPEKIASTNTFRK
jgi:hypothetical protein